MQRLIVADTHAWLWWVTDKSLLSAAARQALDSGAIVAISTMTLLEIATAARRGRIEIDGPADEWIADAITRSRTIDLAVESEIAIAAGLLVGQLGDPADRVIIATALHHRAPLVTKDQRIRDSGLVETIW